MLLQARDIAAHASIAVPDYAVIQRLVGDSRLVPIVASLHDLAQIRLLSFDD